MLGLEYIVILAKHCDLLNCFALKLSESISIFYIYKPINLLKSVILHN